MYTKVIAVSDFGFINQIKNFIPLKPRVISNRVLSMHVTCFEILERLKKTGVLEYLDRMEIKPEKFPKNSIQLSEITDFNNYNSLSSEKFRYDQETGTLFTMGVITEEEGNILKKIFPNSRDQQNIDKIIQKSIAGSLFRWEGDKVVYNKEMFAKIKGYTVQTDHDIKIQFHFPFKDEIFRKAEVPNSAKKIDQFLSMGRTEDHERLLKIFISYFQAIKENGLPSIITFHPPFVDEHENEEEIESAIVNGNKFLILLGKYITDNNIPVVIGMENQPTPGKNGYKKGQESVGYKMDHFVKLLEGTNDSIQITFDSGHRNIAEDMSYLGMLAYCKEAGKYIANFHFHSNHGILEEHIRTHTTNDEHNFPEPKLINGYSYYLLRSVLENVPLNLEIMFYNYNDDQLEHYVKHLRGELDRIYQKANRIYYTKPDNIPE